ncbi:hypothetical protein PQX77_007910 [Marasmius sp. AFHP31]|nr:hypothetical protein PQX77_007910 [Marasmius sp. AFHP31]
MDVLNLTEHDLLRNIPPEGFTGNLLYTDGLVPCLHPRTHEFVTSPNVSTIPAPPFGSTRDLYRREDGLYSADDPIQTPQPLNNHNLYPAWIPRSLSDDEHPYILDSDIWTRISPDDTEYTAQGLACREGVLRGPLASGLAQVVDCLWEHSKQFRQASVISQINVPALIQEFDDTLTICLDRVQNVSMSFRDVQRGFSELRRAWAYSVALLDWVKQSSGSSSGNRIQCPEDRMGAFVWTDRDALFLQRFCLPIYYMRLYCAFDRQIVLTVKPFREPFICSTTSTPPYPVLLSNSQAGSDDKFAALRGAAATCFLTSSPFGNMHLPGAYSSSYTQGSAGQITSPVYSQPSSSAGASSSAGVFSSAGSVTRLSSSSSSKRYSPIYGDQTRKRSKKRSQNAPQQQRSLFEDHSHPILPHLFPTFVGLNTTIDDRHSERRTVPGKAPKLEQIVPDPAVFVGTNDDAKRQVYLVGWRRMRPSWLACCQTLTHLKAVFNGVWRKLLFLESSGSWPSGKVPSSQSDEDHQQATILLNDTLHNFPTSVSSKLPPPSKEESKLMMHELSIINFRFQLVSLDCMLDQTIPQAHHSISQAELQVLRLTHQRQRAELVATFFGGSYDTFLVHGAMFTLGFAAERWHDHVDALKALARLMQSWPGVRDGIWERENDPNLAQLVGPGMEWEKVLYKFFVQSYFNVFGFPPVLPRHRT